jgi:hypothetical protein
VLLARSMTAHSYSKLEKSAVIDRAFYEVVSCQPPSLNSHSFPPRLGD